MRGVRGLAAVLSLVIPACSSAQIPAPPLPCDVDGDGEVDLFDIQGMLADRGANALPGGTLDIDRDGVITVNDARRCALMCTRPTCAPADSSGPPPPLKFAELALTGVIAAQDVTTVPENCHLELRAVVKGGPIGADPADLNKRIISSRLKCVGSCVVPGNVCRPRFTPAAPPNPAGSTKGDCQCNGNPPSDSCRLEANLTGETLNFIVCPGGATCADPETTCLLSRVVSVPDVNGYRNVKVFCACRMP